MASRLTRVTAILAAGLLAAAALVTAKAKDRLSGPGRSISPKARDNPGPAPGSQITDYEAVGQGYRVTVKSEFVSGAKQQWADTSGLDGKDAAISGGTIQNADTIAVKRIDALTLETVNKKGGKVTTTQRNVVAADGRTCTVTTTGTDAEGREGEQRRRGPEVVASRALPGENPAGRSWRRAARNQQAGPGHGPLGDRSMLLKYRDMLVTVRDRVKKLKRERTNPR